MYKRQGQQRQHVGSAHLVAGGDRLGAKELVEFGMGDFGALEFRPGVLEVVVRIDHANEILRQAALVLEPREGLELSLLHI